MRRDPSVEVGGNAPVECPYCGSTDTTRDHPKGPSLCRSIHFCNDCLESFEAMG